MNQSIDPDSDKPRSPANRQGRVSAAAVKLIASAQACLEHYPAMMDLEIPGQTGPYIIQLQPLQPLLPNTLLGTPPDYELLNELIQLTVGSCNANPPAYRSSSIEVVQFELAMKVIRDYKVIKSRQIDPKIAQLNALLK